ncbi:hypothetical protein [Stenotrophomonas sp. MMGLT7]|uniref:hypothetical protein n=1 Tax=Stenotrophomonas sp. MMGLT7 TaxID=2901227 RepID=UPI001E33DCC5|nr:hypothetical protein [Stenotrophomonas sp. MMGLT7]MCD7096951.1 hypothetical protein [Stenotrophomonas sp. MMGLT7]
MIEGITFSGTGDRVTDLEIKLLAQYEGKWALGTLGRRLIETLGAQVGAQALAIMLDELGPDRVYIAKREQFFGALWRQQRDDLIRSMRANGYAIGEITQMLGIARSTANRAIKCPTCVQTWDITNR